MKKIALWLFRRAYSVEIEHLRVDMYNKSLGPSTSRGIARALGYLDLR